MVDSTTQEPIPYCNIFQINKQGFVSNHIGEFCLNVSNSDTLNFSISNLAYKERSFSIHKQSGYSILYLAPKQYQINEVDIDWKSYKFHDLGNNFNRVDSYLSLWRFCQVGIYIPPLKRGKGIIQQVSIPVKNNTKVQVPFRLHVYKATESLNIGSDLLPTNVYGLLSSSKELIRLDLMKYQIEIPPEGVFVSVELLSNNKPEELQIGTGTHYKEKNNNKIGMCKARYRHRKSIKLSSWKPGSFYIEKYPFTGVEGMVGELPLIKAKVRQIQP